MNVAKEKGAALLTVIIIIFILLILSSVALNLLSNQTRLVEHDISRIKSKYANEAAMVRQLERLRNNELLESQHGVPGRYDDPGRNWDVKIDNSTTGSGLNEIELSINYTTPF